MKLPQVGTRFASKYELHEAIGQGGFATVFRAEDITIGRNVALKILTPGEDGYAHSTASRFEREARVLAGLRDPHTVHLYESGTSPDGLLFMAFELLDGDDLSNIIGPTGTFDEAATRHVLKQVLASLREAHHAGLLHRDLKPSNVRIYEYMGDPLCAKLMDFGIARSTTQDGPAITRQGELVGTPRYMSPEQMAGGEMTPASDLYSLAMVAFEMLMGTEASPLSSIASGQTIPINASPQFADMLNRMLRRDARDRIQTADAVIAALDRPAGPVHQAASRPVPATSPTQTAAGDTALSNRTLLTVLGVLGALVLACVAVLALSLREDEPPPPTPVSSTNPGLTQLLKKPTTEVPVPAVVTTDVAVAADMGVLSDVDSAPPTKDGCGAYAGKAKKSMFGVGRSRWVTVLPNDYDPDVRHPLLLLFPQLGVSAHQTMTEMKLRRLANVEGLVIVAPREGQLAWVGETDFITEMVDVSVSRLCIDESRIFALGHGTGGSGAELAACEPWLTALATTSYRSLQPSFPCDEPRPIPTLHLAPLESGHLPVDGGPSCGGFQSIVSLDVQEAMWRERNGCSGKPKKRSMGKGNVCFESTCDDAKFTSCHLNGGHGWIARQRLLDFAKCDGEPADFPYLDTIWAFFSSVQ